MQWRKGDMINSNKKILIAEDEEILREMLGAVIQDEDYHVNDAVNGVEALSLLKENDYDLLLTDLFMPEMNGIDLIVNCQSLFPDIKVIMLSGGGKDVQAEHGGQHVKYFDQEVDIDMFLEKPCDLIELMTVLKTVLTE